MVHREFVILREIESSAFPKSETTERPSVQLSAPEPPAAESSGPLPPAAAVNLAQRVLLIAGFLIVLGMALFPPWLYVFKYPGLPQTERAAGYFLIFEQHSPQDRAALAALFGAPLDEAERRFFSLQIDRTRLTVQIGATLILITILYLALRSAKPPISN